jgi:hypothetical protein
MSHAPRVSVLMAAHNAAAFVDEALRSALAQDYPAEQLHVIVVDDGSTDETGMVVARVAAEHPGRVRLIRQKRHGQVAAINRAAAEAAGDLLAFIDADDAWPADKIARQVELLEARPEVGLVYTDLRVIDAAGRVLEDSWVDDARPPEGRDVGRFLAQNAVMTSTILVRAGLREALFPIPAEMPWPDWWLAVRSAQCSHVAYLAEPKTLYRFHGANMSLGAEGAARLAELRKALALQRWFLRRLDVPATPVADLERAWDGFGRMAEEARAVAGSPFAELLHVTADDRDEAAALAAQACELLEHGALHEALGSAVCAAAADPGCDEVRATLARVRAAMPSGAGQQPLRGARDVVIGVHGDELLHDPELLAACAEHLGDLAGVTLAIDASTADPVEATVRMEALVAAHGLADAALDVVVVTGPLDELGRARLAHGLTAVVGARRASPAIPHYPRGRVHEVRALVAG